MIRGVIADFFGVENARWTRALAAGRDEGYLRKPLSFADSGAISCANMQTYANTRQIKREVKVRTLARCTQRHGPRGVGVHHRLGRSKECCRANGSISFLVCTVSPRHPSPLSLSLSLPGPLSAYVRPTPAPPHPRTHTRNQAGYKGPEEAGGSMVPTQ